MRWFNSCLLQINIPLSQNQIKYKLYSIETLAREKPTSRFVIWQDRNQPHELHLQSAGILKI